MNRYLKEAAKKAIKGHPTRKAYIGCLGIRNDGTTVYSWNGSILGCRGGTTPEAHAEARLARKLDVGSTVYVARVRRDNGKMAMSRPCRDCERVLRSRGVRKVFYTIGPKEYGVMEFGK